MPDQARIVYSPRYDYWIPIPGLQRWHPFDARKFSRVYRELRRRYPGRLDDWITAPAAPASRSYLEKVHDPDYLDSLDSFRVVCRVLEVPLRLRWWLLLAQRLMPYWRMGSVILKPMLWGTMGTLRAAELALEHGSAVNLSGGYHHAWPDNGEGFCFYADVALAVKHLWKTGRLGADDRVLYIDLDAHQGNGVERTFYDEPRVCIYDMYNGANFPGDRYARSRINEDVPLVWGTTTDEYLATLRGTLPNYVKVVSARRKPRLAIYNAGTDIYEGDALGGLAVSREGVLERDRFVFDTLTGAGIPWVMVLSGGYSAESYLLVAESVLFLLGQWPSVRRG
jgi:histone deacetylase 11